VIVLASCTLSTARHHFRPWIIQESPKIAAFLAMVALGEGITVLYESITTRAVPHAVFRLLTKPGVSIPHAFVFRKADESPALGQFIAALKAGKVARTS